MAANQDINSWIRQQVNASEILSPEEEIRLVTGWQTGKDTASRNALVEAHQKLVAAMASKFANSGADFSDLFNEGIIALISAADRFDPSRQNRFSTYAAWWILSQLQEAVHRDIYSVKIGRSRSEKKALRLLGTARQYLDPSLDPTIIERIAELSGADVETIERIDGAIASRSVSLNCKIGPDGQDGAEVGDMIECTTARDLGAEARLLNGNQKEILSQVMCCLKDPRAAKIIRERWLDTDEKSLKDIGADLDISAERVRQIERDALREIREALIGRGYQPSMIIG